MAHFDIIVVGGGLVGAAFTLDLACQNPQLEIALLEPKPVELPDLTNQLDNKIYAVSPANLNYLSSIGGLPDEARMGVIKKMDIYGDNNSNLLLDSKDAKRFFLAKTIEYSYLQQHLYRKLQDLVNVHFIYGHIENILVNDLSAELICSEQHYTAELIIGSDGANSTVRKFAGIEVEEIRYTQSGVVANFNCELPHHDIASQWFYNGHTLAYLPLAGNQISIVWSHPSASELISLEADEFCAKVGESGKHKLGKLTLQSKPMAFPLRLFLVKRLYNKRIALIGDAAHTIHPLAGQGVNLGFADAKVLAQILTNVKKYQLGDESLLARYNVQRMPAIREMQMVCHGLHNLFNTSSEGIAYLRNLGLNMVNQLSIVKKHLIKRAVKY